MGKIFGISDNPVSTLDKTISIGGGIVLPKPKETYAKSRLKSKADQFISKKADNKSNAFLKMRNGFGKLMSHFSKVNK